MTLMTGGAWFLFEAGNLAYRKVRARSTFKAFARVSQLENQVVDILRRLDPVDRAQASDIVSQQASEVLRRHHVGI
jgi:hypothetical protein